MEEEKSIELSPFSNRLLVHSPVQPKPGLKQAPKPEIGNCPYCFIFEWSMVPGFIEQLRFLESDVKALSFHIQCGMSSLSNEPSPISSESSLLPSEHILLLLWREWQRSRHLRRLTLILRPQFWAFPDFHWKVAFSHMENRHWNQTDHHILFPSLRNSVTSFPSEHQFPHMKLGKILLLTSCNAHEGWMRSYM